MLPFARSFAFRRLLAAAFFCGGVLSAGQQPGQLPPAAGTPQAVPQSYKPITGEERFRWFAVSTVGPTSLLLAGPLSAGWGTLRESPEEYGRTWKGFGQRYGMRLTGIATSNAIEALSGIALGEDPRYIPAPAGSSFGRRTRHVLISTFVAYRPDGSRRLSYSRIAGNIGSNFLSNTWRVESESSASDASLRCVWGLTSRMSSFAFSEFWPVLARRLRRR
jgi:hypothetical protein